MDRPPRQLDQIQRWLQAVIVHPDGVESGINSPAAQAEFDVDADTVERLITRSRQLSSLQRLGIYANAYYARLLECLRDDFPALVQCLGEDAFNAFAFGYLQSYPSRSYTLADLGRNFARYLAETRPADFKAGPGVPDWEDFLIDLATVERTYAEVFDGPGVETGTTLSAGVMAALDVELWQKARLVPVLCLRLLRLKFPVHEYIRAARRQGEPLPPQPAPTLLAVTRRDYVVRVAVLAPDEFEMLSSLVYGASVRDAILGLAERPGANVELLAESLRSWFRRWAAAPYFQAVESDE